MKKDPMEPLNHEHYYVPAKLITVWGMMPVSRYTIYGKGSKLLGCPIRDGMTVVECTGTPDGQYHGTKAVRWFGCRDAYINADLRCVIVGVNPRDEVVSKWDKVPAELRSNA